MRSKSRQELDARRRQKPPSQRRATDVIEHHTITITIAMNTAPSSIFGTWPLTFPNLSTGSDSLDYLLTKGDIHFKRASILFS